MPGIIYAPSKDGHHDGSIGKQIYAFLQKLARDDTTPGLHIEPMKSPRDSRVRTGRVTQMYRAVLFKLVPEQGDPQYVFHGVWPHDEAIEIARSSTLKLNPVNGIPELIRETAPTEPTPAATPPVSAAPAAIESRDESPAALGSLLGRLHPAMTRAHLEEQLGFSAEFATLTLAVRDEDEAIDLAHGRPAWEGEALLQLAAGDTIADVRKSLELRAPDEDDKRSPDEQLLEGFRQPAARAEFAWLEDDEELRRVVESGDFNRWRTFLHPEQRRYVEQSTSGPFRLSGGAGTGKTVVLLHRARRLARANPDARIVLTTFTKTLAEQLRRDLRLLDPAVPQVDEPGRPGVFVTGVDAAANAMLSRASKEERAAATARVLGPSGNRGATRTQDGQKAWRNAASGVDLPATLTSPAFLEAEYQQVVLPARVTTGEEYARVRRPGRGVSLGRRQRAAVWQIVQAYRAAAAVDGSLDFAEVCAIAAELEGAPVADHVLIDEGQDLSAPQWQFLRSLAAEGPNDLFIAEDSQQRIYGQRVTLGRYGIKIVGRSRRLSLNYRTTEQVLRFAVGVLSGTEYLDAEDATVDDRSFRSARSGPPPAERPAASVSEELTVASEIVQGWIAQVDDPSSIGVLVRDRRTMDLVARGFEERRVDLKPVTGGAGGGSRPQLLTMHRAKGMEFECVLIFGVSRGALPASYVLADIPDEDRADALQRERSLFYVAATRARSELAVVWEGEPSEFLPTGSRSESPLATARTLQA